MNNWSWARRTTSNSAYGNFPICRQLAGQGNSGNEGPLTGIGMSFELSNPTQSAPSQAQQQAPPISFPAEVSSKPISSNVGSLPSMSRTTVLPNNARSPTTPSTPAQPIAPVTAPVTSTRFEPPPQQHFNNNSVEEDVGQVQVEYLRGDEAEAMLKRIAQAQSAQEQMGQQQQQFPSSEIMYQHQLPPQVVTSSSRGQSGGRSEAQLINDASGNVGGEGDMGLAAMAQNERNVSPDDGEPPQTLLSTSTTKQAESQSPNKKSGGNNRSSSHKPNKTDGDAPGGSNRSFPRQLRKYSYDEPPLLQPVRAPYSVKPPAQVSQSIPRTNSYPRLPNKPAGASISFNLCGRCTKCKHIQPTTTQPSNNRVLLNINNPMSRSTPPLRNASSFHVRREKVSPMGRQITTTIFTT